MIDGIVTVKFIDGETLCFSNVDDYGFTEDSGVIYVKRNGIKAFFLASHVKYIGVV